MTLPLLTAVHPDYICKILTWRGIEHSSVGSLQTVNGFDAYNNLVAINQLFSTHPKGDIIDRTNTVLAPLKFHVQRPWQVPARTTSLEQAMYSRVQQYLQMDQLLNICWSGGIDSTCLLAAFLKHCRNFDQIRILYSPWSVYEHKAFYDFVKINYPQVRWLDISGDVYLDNRFDGHFVTGHGGDEFTASLDESFYNSVGSRELHQSWKDFFYNKTQSSTLVSFAEQYFALAGRPIETLLQARWCFYVLAKSQIYPTDNNSFLLNQDNYSRHSVSGFFDCVDFESYVFSNTDQILLPGKDYHHYKQFLKDYIYQFDRNLEFCQTATKRNSGQFLIYIQKKMQLLDCRWIFKLSNDTVVRTKNLPLLSQLEFEAAYGNSLDYLFNSPGQI